MNNFNPKNKYDVVIGDFFELLDGNKSEIFEIVGTEFYGDDDEKLELAFILPSKDSIAVKYNCCLISPDEQFVNTRRITWAPNINVNFAHKYLGWIALEKVNQVFEKVSEGCFCASCKHFFDYAIANQTDKTFICYSCKQNPIRAYY